MDFRYKIREYWEESRGEIIAGIVLAALSTIAVIVFSETARMFLTDTHIPLWFVLLLIMFTGVATFTITKRVITTKKPPGVSFIDFVSCKINNVEYRWNWLFNYNKRQYEIKNLRPVCPKCGSDIYYKEFSEKYFCPNGHDISKYDMDDSWLYKYIYNQIEAKYKEDIEYIDISSMLL